MDVSSLNESLKSLSAAERLKAVCDFINAEGLVFSTSLGQEDQIITQLIASQLLPIQIFTLDTGRLFQETYDLIDRTTARYKINIRIYFPNAENVQQLTSTKGMNSFYESVENRKECCAIRKVEPLQRALKNKKVWITGLRAEQSDNRKNLPFAEWDEHYQLIKVNPILDWTLADVLNYINENNIPYNPLHDKGFLSIGCAPCTRAVEPGEDIRAGRWWWETSKKECGLHEETSMAIKQ
jgi:phosphoadenosine phosphosulfate reductase